MSRRSVALLYALPTLTLAGALVIAGPLDPPAGAPAPTYKTLSEVEPRTIVGPDTTPGDFDATYVISEPGSYYLTGNILGEERKHGIQITASNVTLDLMGFDVAGVPASFVGIFAEPGLHNIAVRNGTVRDWGSHGVGLGVVDNTRVENIRAYGNAAWGIVGGDNAVVTGCTAVLNQFHGIGVATNGVISNCSTERNAGAGFQLGSSTVVTGCTSTEDGGYGFHAPGAVTLKACSAHKAAMGFWVGAHSTVSDCHAFACTADGFQLGNGALATGCTAASNGENGFSLFAGAAVANSIAMENMGNGISLGIYCAARDCTVRTNMEEGIYVAGNYCRVEGNHIASHTVGMRVISTGNTIVRNSAAQNATDYIFAILNNAGPVVTPATINTDTNPHANYAD